MKEARNKGAHSVQFHLYTQQSFLTHIGFLFPQESCEIAIIKVTNYLLVTKPMGYGLIIILYSLQHLTWLDASLFDIPSSFGLSFTTSPLYHYSPSHLQAFSFQILSQASLPLASTDFHLIFIPFLFHPIIISLLNNLTHKYTFKSPSLLRPS